VIRGADISSDGIYRYLLERDWDDVEQPASRERTVGFVMLNPSTADASVDDPTIRRCVGFARAWGYTRLLVGNLFALRATDPAELRTRLAPVGPRNDGVLLALPMLAEIIVCAWGVHGAFRGRDAQVLEVLRGATLRTGHIRHLGLTKAGAPRHPLYLRADIQPIAWEQPRKAVR
jgi:hypothetical protein